jgi:hypothetical protein
MPTKTLTIYDIDFQVEQPYAEGHVINAHEARALNQTRGENISNNFRSEVKKVTDLAEGPDREAKIADLKKRFAEYEADYSFATGGGRISDPIERRARQMIKDAFKEHLAASGRKISDVPEDVLEQKIVENLTPELLAEAKKRLDAEKKQAEKAKGMLKFG